MDYTGPGDETAGKDAVFIGFGRFLDTIGGHQDRAGKSREFFLLVLPGTTIVADKMLVFFEPRIAVRR